MDIKDAELQINILANLFDAQAQEIIKLQSQLLNQGTDVKDTKDQLDRIHEQNRWYLDDRYRKGLVQSFSEVHKTVANLQNNFRNETKHRRTQDNQIQKQITHLDQTTFSASVNNHNGLEMVIKRLAKLEKPWYKKLWERIKNQC